MFNTYSINDKDDLTKTCSSRLQLLSHFNKNFFPHIDSIFIFHDIKQFKMILEVLTFKKPPIRKEGEKKNVQEAQAWVVFENVSSITNAIKNI